MGRALSRGGLTALGYGRDHHFADAVAGGLEGGAYSGALEAQKAAQQASAGIRSTSHVGGRNDTIPEETVVFPEDREVMNNRIVGDIGLEPMTPSLSS